MVVDGPDPGYPPLLVFADDWGRHPSSCQHLIRGLADRRQVHWVNTIGMRNPRIDLATLARGVEKIRQWAGRRPGPAEQATDANPRVHNPRMWPWFSTRLDRRLNKALLLRQLVPVIESMPAPPVAVTTLPITSDLIGAMPVERWVYYCVDDFGQWPGLNQAPLRGMERDLVQRADVLIAAGEVLRDRIAGMGRDAHLLTHGVDLDHWAPDAAAGEPIAGLEGLARPLIVFWGVVDRRMDVAMLRRLGSDLERGTILLVGPEDAADPNLAGCPRVVRFGPMPYRNLPRLAREADALVMPYADLPVTRAMQPLKLKEYLATGKPVVVRDLPATRPWADCLDLVDTPEGFSEAVRTCLARGVPEGQRAARRRLDREGWSEKARDFEALVYGAGRRDASRRVPEGAGVA